MYRTQSYELNSKEMQQVKDYVAFMKEKDLKPVDQGRDLISAFGAELAFAKMSGAEHSFDPYRNWKYDCVWCGYLTDVKQTALHNQFLLTEKERADENDLVEIYVHMKGKAPYFEYWGWQEKKYLVTADNYKRTFGGRVDKKPYSIHEKECRVPPPKPKGSHGEEEN